MCTERKATGLFVLPVCDNAHYVAFCQTPHSDVLPVQTSCCVTVCCVAIRTKLTAMVMAGRSVHLTTLLFRVLKIK